MEENQNNPEIVEEKVEELMYECKSCTCIFPESKTAEAKVMVDHVETRIIRLCPKCHGFLDRVQVE